MTDGSLLPDDEIDRMLTGITTAVIPAGLRDGPNEDTPVGLNGAELITAARMILTANRQGVPVGQVRVDNARRLIRRARALGMSV